MKVTMQKTFFLLDEQLQHFRSCVEHLLVVVDGVKLLCDEIGAAVVEAVTLKGEREDVVLCQLDHLWVAETTDGSNDINVIIVYTLVAYIIMYIAEDKHFCELVLKLLVW